MHNFTACLSLLSYHTFVDFTIDFVLCGAFSNKADEIAKNSNIGHSIGFGAVPHTAKAYDRPLTAQDLIEYGVMPEFMGRIQRIVNLQPMTLEDYYKIMGSGCGPNMKADGEPVEKIMRYTGLTEADIERL